MHYYPRYIGDYAKDTADLTLLEHGVYAIMLDHYYIHEKPLPKERQRLYTLCGAATASERKAVDTVTTRFFSESGSRLHNKRADREIQAFHERGEKARENGKKGGRPPKVPRDENPEITDSVSSGLGKPPVLETQKKANSEFRIQNTETKRESEADSCTEPVDATAAVQTPAMMFPIRALKGQPHEWPLFADRIADYQECYPGIDALAEAKKARQWCIDNASNRKTSRGMAAFLNRWMAKAQDDSGKNANGTGRRPNAYQPGRGQVHQPPDGASDQAGSW